MKKKKIASIIAVLSITTTIFAGCGSIKSSAAQSNTSQASEKSGKDVKATTVRVAVANDFSPFAYLDKNGKYTGYEVDVLKEVDKLLPEYNFEYQTVSDQFVALTSNKVDLITHQWESNPERQKKYLFAKQLITNWTEYIIFKDGRTDINTLDDLAGKTVLTWQGSNDAYFLETYNKSHNNAIKLQYTTADNAAIIQQLENGSIDAFDEPASIATSLEKQYNVKLGISKSPLYNSGTYFIYRKDDASETKLQTAVDTALKTLTDNGTLSKLSTKYLGSDYTKETPIDSASATTSQTETSK